MSLASSSMARSSSTRKRSAATGVRASRVTARTRAPSPWPTCSGSSRRRTLNDKFLIHDALDEDGVGTTRVQAHATIRLTIPLPPWLSLADDPGARQVTVFRGIPSTRNTPALDPVLLHDGRAPTLQEQARGAILDHYQNTVEPTIAQLDAIAAFQRTDPRFFSSRALRKFAATGAPPELPPGITPAERRGREFLVDAPFSPPSKRGICALCHGGPMLNMVNQAYSTFLRGSPPVGARFINTGVTIVNAPNNPIRTWVVDDGINPVVRIDSPDLGAAPRPHSSGRPTTTVRHPPRLLCGAVQDPDAVGRQGHRALLPRQRRQDAPRRRRALSAVLQLHGGAGPGWFAVSRRLHRADRQRRRRHRRLPEASRFEPVTDITLGPGLVGMTSNLRSGGRCRDFSRTPGRSPDRDPGKDGQRQKPGIGDRPRRQQPRTKRHPQD